MMIEEHGFSLPRLRRITIAHLSLYSAVDIVDEPYDRDVFCLAGANGLGKSTFLATVNYGLTGIVSDPTEPFRSVHDFYKDNVRYSSEYFGGRLKEDDRELAVVSLEFTINGHGCRIARSLVDPTDVRELRFGDISENLDPTPLGADVPEDLTARYEEFIVEQAGLDNFRQFIFLQHFVLTFDERRRLLFWDERLAGQALHLAFGVDPEKAQRADALYRESEKADSRARNSRWQAKKVKDAMDSLRKQKTLLEPSERDSDTVELYRSLTGAVEKSERNRDAAQQRLEDAELVFTRTASQRLTIRSEYEEAFERIAQRRPAPARHPLVLQTLHEDRCGVCRNDAGAWRVDLRSIVLHQSQCPLCGSSVSESTAGGEPEHDIEALVTKYEQATKDYQSARDRTDRLRDELKVAEEAATRVRQALRQFEDDHEGIKTVGRIDGTSVEAVLESYVLQHEHFNDEVLKHRRQRDLLRKELRQIEREVHRSYERAEQDFVPAFRSLAEAFLGLDLDVRLEAGRTGLRLGLEVEGTARRSAEALSESQRYFVDIALRMALIQQMARSGQPAMLSIDTPEGYLDIAYESRAGAMFAAFVDQGHSLLLTANINTSQLLLQLATRCGSAQMRLVRMTDWAPLSDVQVEEEGLFRHALNAIEDRLLGAEASP